MQQLSEDYLRFHNTNYNLYSNNECGLTITSDGLDTPLFIQLKENKYNRGNGAPVEQPTLPSGMRWELCEGTAEEMEAIAATDVTCLVQKSLMPPPGLGHPDATTKAGLCPSDATTNAGDSGESGDEIIHHKSGSESLHRVTTLSASDLDDSAEEREGTFSEKSPGNQEDSDPDDAVQDENWTIGGKLHASGKCNPCRFFHSKRGCRNSTECGGCHLHDTKKQRPSKSRRNKARDGARELTEDAVANHKPSAARFLFLRAVL